MKAFRSMHVVMTVIALVAVFVGESYAQGNSNSGFGSGNSNSGFGSGNSNSGFGSGFGNSNSGFGSGSGSDSSSGFGTGSSSGSGSGSGSTSGSSSGSGSGSGSTSGSSSGSGSACLNQLIPCLNYLSNRQSGQNPPDSCCDPLKSVIKSNPECLCSMISNQGTKNAERAGVNVTRAQELPARCGQRVNPISCLTSTSKNTPGSSDSQSLGYSLYPLMIIAALYGLSMF